MRAPGRPRAGLPAVSVEAALAICRFGNDAAAMLLWGAFAYLAVLVPPALRDELDARFGTFRTVAVLVTAVTSAALLPTETASIGDGWPAALDPATLDAVLGGTDVGRTLVLRLGVALLLVAALPVRRPSRAALTARLAAARLATLALTGPAAMHGGALGLAHRLNDALHVLAAGAWVGALLPLLPTLRALDHQGFRADALVALRRFSRVGQVDVALVVATGAANTALVPGRLPTDWSASYQLLLSAKIASVAVMVLLALTNRYVFVPRLARHPATARDGIRRSTRLEVGLGLVAIACVSVFGLLDPS